VNEPIRVGLHNCLPRALKHYASAVEQLLVGAGGVVKPLDAVDIELNGVSFPGKLSVAAHALRERSRSLSTLAYGKRVLVTWPAFGFLDYSLWRAPVGTRVSVVMHDPMPLRRQVGLSPISAQVGRRCKSPDVDMIVHSEAALQSVARRGFGDATRLPLPMFQPSSEWEPQRSVVVLGQFKTARDLELMVKLAPGLSGAGLFPEVWGRDWPAVTGWSVHAGYLSESHFNRVLREAACLVLPYSRLFQSDVAVRAAEAGVPVVGPSLSNLSELFGEDWPGAVRPGASAREWIERVIEVSTLTPEEVFARLEGRYESILSAWAAWLPISTGARA